MLYLFRLVIVLISLASVANAQSIYGSYKVKDISWSLEGKVYKKIKRSALKQVYSFQNDGTFTIKKRWKKVHEGTYIYKNSTLELTIPSLRVAYEVEWAGTKYQVETLSEKQLVIRQDIDTTYNITLNLEKIE